MSKKTYIGINNISKEIKKIYVGVDEKPRRVKKAFLGVNNVAKLVFVQDVILTLNLGTGIKSVNWNAITPEGISLEGTETQNKIIILPYGSSVQVTPEPQDWFFIEEDYSNPFVLIEDSIINFNAIEIPSVNLTISLGTGVSSVTYEVTSAPYGYKPKETVSSNKVIKLEKNSVVKFTASSASGYDMNYYQSSQTIDQNKTISFTASRKSVYVYIDTYYNGYSDSGCGYATVDGSSNYVTAYPGDYLDLDYGANDGFAFDYFDYDYGRISGSYFIVPNRNCNIYAYFEAKTTKNGNASKTGYNVSYFYSGKVTSTLYAGGTFDSLPSGWYSGGETISGGYTVKTTNDYDSTVDEQYYPVSFSVNSRGVITPDSTIPASRSYTISGINFVENVYLNISGSWSV